VGEDLVRGRVYLPVEDLERFRVDVTARTVTPGWRALVRFETDRAGALYSSADEGIELLPAWSARSIRTARVLHAPHPRRDRRERLRRVLDESPRSRTVPDEVASTVHTPSPARRADAGRN